jgi:hypothetical protein
MDIAISARRSSARQSDHAQETQGSEKAEETESAKEVGEKDHPAACGCAGTSLTVLIFATASRFDL